MQSIQDLIFIFLSGACILWALVSSAIKSKNAWICQKCGGQRIKHMPIQNELHNAASAVMGIATYLLFGQNINPQNKPEGYLCTSCKDFKQAEDVEPSLPGRLFLSAVVIGILYFAMNPFHQKSPALTFDDSFLLAEGDIFSTLEDSGSNHPPKEEIAEIDSSNFLPTKLQAPEQQKPTKLQAPEQQKPTKQINTKIKLTKQKQKQTSFHENIQRNEMLLIPSGCFDLGSSEGDKDEYPSKRICLTSFWMDKTEVTVKKYKKCYYAKRCKKPKYGRNCNWLANKNKHPINCVSWYDATNYCKWLGKQLPTEAQWEYAARGVNNNRYPWGNEPHASCDLTVMYDGTGGCGADGTWPVGSKEKDKSVFNIMDLAGNVMEWTLDCYSHDFYRYIKESAKNPINKRARCLYRTVRGSDWSDEQKKYFRSANRDKVHVKKKLSDLGFRCVQNF